MCTPTGGLINPANFPVPTASPGTLEMHARALRRKGSTVSGLGSDIKSDWAGLTSCYSAPEAETLYAVVDPVAADGDKVETSFGKAATALENFADAVRDIQGKWATLKTDSYAFLSSIEGDEDWREADGFIDGLLGRESDKVGEHQALLDRADALRREYETAEIACANALNADIQGRTRFVAGDGDGKPPAPGVYEHGYDGYLGDVDMAWGGSVETDHGWWVDAGSAVKDYAVGIAEDLGGMTGMYSSEGWFQKSWGDALFEYHEGNLQSLASLAGMYDSENDSWGWSGWDTVGNAWKDAAHAVVPWEEWGDRPGYVIGTALLNIGATVGGAVLTATGVGAVVGVPLMAWRGSAMLNKMGGDGPGTPDVDVPDMSQIRLPDLPRFGGNSLADLNIDLSRFTGGSFSPSQLSGMRTLLERLTSQNAIDSGGGNTPQTPDSSVRPVVNDGGEDTPANNRRNVDPTTQNLQDTADFLEMMNNPDMNSLDVELDRRYQNGFAENDGKPQPDRGRGEGPWEGDDIGPDRPDDGLENEPALVRVGGDDTLTAEADAPRDRTDQVIGDRSAIDSDALGDLGDGFDDIVGDRFDTDGPQMRDRTSPVMNSDGDGGDPLDGTGDPRGGTDVPDESPSGDGGGTGSTGGGGQGAGDTRPTNVGGDLIGGGGDQNGGSENTSIKDQPELHRGSTDDPRVQRLLPENGLRFAEYRDDSGDVQNIKLEEDSRYVVVEEDGNRRTEYITDGEGNIKEIRAGSQGWDSKHPEFLAPRPDMTYNVDGYTYRTDEYGRTVSVEGTLHKDPNVRNDDEQSKVNSQGSDYYKELNKQNRAQFEADHGRPPEPGEIPEYQGIQWDGGHLIGYAEFFGIGERLNQVPMRYDVNQNRTETALDDIPEDVRGGIEGSYRNIERSWRGIMNHGANWHNFDNPKFNDGSWNDALALNPDSPKVEVKITNIYNPELPVLEDKHGNPLPPPPSKIVVEWSLNGVDMKPQEYNNIPPKVKTGGREA
ncbi:MULTISPECIES: DNA/RNA non-specific endonuclease [Nocardiopsis]|nr:MULTISPECIES: DNA/RNA non-specific endonuclease [Nocardiopsis]